MTIRQASRAALVAGALAALGACATDDDLQSAAHAPPGGAGTFDNRAAITQDQLLGLDTDQLAGLLGPPDFRRNDGPAEIWQFRDARCVLDVFLYADPQMTFRVAHVEARDRLLVRAAEPGCASNLLRERRARAAALPPASQG